MEAVGQLTGGTAHDFNNLLMIIGGSLDMLGRRVADDAKVSILLDAARQAVGRGAKLNQQLLAFSRRQDLQMEVVQVNDPDLDVRAFRLGGRSSAVGETVKLEFVKDPKLWECRTDPHQLETAILNLVINARDDAGREDSSSSRRRTAKPMKRSSPLGSVGWRLRRGIGRRHRHWNVTRSFEPYIRALFTTKDVGKRDRPRFEPGLRIRQASRAGL